MPETDDIVELLKRVLRLMELRREGKIWAAAELEMEKQRLSTALAERARRRVKKAARDSVQNLTLH